MSAVIQPLSSAAYLDERIEEKEYEVAWLEDMYAGLRDRIRDWREWNDELCGISLHDKQEIAAEECAIALDEARAQLAELIRQASGTSAMARDEGGVAR